MSALQTKQQLDREAWLAGALELLRENGVDAVRVEPLAARLGVTKGSFYWHFRNRQDLLASLPQFWADRQTGPVLAYGMAAEGGPVAKLRAVAEYLGREDPDRYDNAMRGWAQFDETVARTVQAIDQRRLAFAMGLFEAAGLSPDEAEVRARLFYFFDVGGQITGDAPADNAEREARSLRRFSALTADLV
jgi:AcrR family transcriptional regulator